MRPIARRFAGYALLLGVLLAALWWWAAPGRAPGPSALTRLPAPDAPAAEAPVTPANTPIDALWKRYEALSRSLPEPATAPLPHTPTEPVAGLPDEVRLSPAQRQRQARTQALLAAREEALGRLQRLAPDDVDGMLDSLEAFNRQLQANGVEAGIHLTGMREILLNSQKISRLNERLMAEALKGAQADPAQLQRLGRELGELQKALTGAYQTYADAAGRP